MRDKLSSMTITRPENSIDFKTDRRNRFAQLKYKINFQ